MNNSTIPEDDLHAYVDDAMSAPERGRFEERLRADPEAARRADAYQRQNEALRAAFDNVRTEPHTLKVPESRSGRWIRSPWALAASLAIGIGIGVLGADLVSGKRASRESLAQQAALAYVAYVPEVRHPVEVGANEEEHLIAWLSKRLALPLRAPRLDAAGYRLLGGRLLPATGGIGNAPVALLMYENTRGKRVSLLFRREPANKDTAFRFAQEGDTRVFYWIDGPYGCALAGDMDREELLRLSRLVYQQLNP